MHITICHDTARPKSGAAPVHGTRRRAAHRERVGDILARLNAAAGPADLDLPGLRLHQLKGAYAGFWAVLVRANWRVIFRFEAGHAVDVDYLDYH